GGKVTTADSSPEGYALALQADGKIILAGSSRPGGNPPVMTLLRYNSNGTLDTSFDGDGIVRTNVVGKARGVVVQPDGKIGAVGHGLAGTGTDVAVLRFNSNGSLDASFDGDGRVLTDLGGDQDIANGVALQADGKIVVVGSTPIAADDAAGAFATLRYNADG